MRDVDDRAAVVDRPPKALAMSATDDAATNANAAVDPTAVMTATALPTFPDSTVKTESVAVCAYLTVARVVAVELRVRCQAAYAIKKRWLVVADYHFDL